MRNGVLDSDSIEQDLDDTRSRLDATIGALQEKLAPGTVVDQAVHYFREGGGVELSRNVARSMRENPIPVALIGVGLGWLMLSSTRRDGHRATGWRDETDRDRFGGAEVQAFDVAGEYTIDVSREGYVVEKKPEEVKLAPASTSASSGWAPPAVTPDPGSAQAYAAGAVAARGWPSTEFDCLVALWSKESGWRVNAYNASSGAYGIPQALPGSKMATAGADWETVPEELAGSWYLDPADRASVHTPEGPRPGPCAGALQVASSDAAIAAVLCDDVTVHVTVDAGVTWLAVDVGAIVRDDVEGHEGRPGALGVPREVLIEQPLPGERVQPRRPRDDTVQVEQERVEAGELDDDRVRTAHGGPSRAQRHCHMRSKPSHAR